MCTEDHDDPVVDLRLGTGGESTENAQCRYFWTVPRVALKFGASATHLDLTVKCEALDGIRHFTGSPRGALGSLVAAGMGRLSGRSELSGARHFRGGLLR